MAPMNIRDQIEFEQKVIQSERPVVVEFWAHWCGACLQVAPVIEEIIKENAEQLALARVNIDINPETQMQYGVRAIPTFIIFKGGSPVSVKVGSLPKNKLVEWIDAVIVGPAETP